MKKPIQRSESSKKTYRMRVGEGTPHLQRMFKKVYNSLRDRGESHENAKKIAAARVNQYRRKHGLLVEDVGRGRWYPGKAPVRGAFARAAQLLEEGDTDRARALLIKELPAGSEVHFLDPEQEVVLLGGLRRSKRSPSRGRSRKT